MFPRLRHRPIRRRHHQDRAIHLRRSRDHVLDVVGVPRAIDVRVVAIRRLVLHVRNRNRDSALPLFRRVINRIERSERHLRVVLAQHLGDRRRQRRLAVIDVPDRPDIQVRLIALKLFLRHSLFNSSVKFVVHEPKSAPLTLSTPLLLDHFFRQTRPALPHNAKSAS